MFESMFAGAHELHMLQSGHNSFETGQRSFLCAHVSQIYLTLANFTKLWMPSNEQLAACLLTTFSSLFCFRLSLPPSPFGPNLLQRFEVHISTNPCTHRVQRTFFWIRVQPSISALLGLMKL
ncbi:hypothetical protein MPTK1_5g06520 [Marchantia polymorpha subsp. ruderalis]|uniref:Uncharacterized protein n=2 Tax=Marchantia polymorpha TaxID=3197 RepID=A0AAF6BFL3_MARPO|nr:hypothetical protein MARPO_0189s0002 [Marchantia polymorpha]BBN10797.1 hypothetical protein Mp_5g06520 [Marchantia polymorpha subsp. ruderalis]|eukprot:PTQ27627.1 hypothetical protein MARPO_0189s0002 [Marchantia polymorpha]